MKNIIVLTSGLSGSSVITHLLSRAGYWTGDKTCVKSDYNTHENSQLVYLNDLLLKSVGYDKEYSQVVRLEKVLEVEQLIDSIDLLPFKSFVAECACNAPWIWKDPRLWVTLPFWIQLLDKSSVQLVFVDRSVSQRWISELLRRNIQSRRYCANYNNQIKAHIKHFVGQYNLPCCDVLFDDFILYPEVTLALLNDYLVCSFSMLDLQAVYNKPLYIKQHGLKNWCVAALIYLKNYFVRLR